MLTDFDQPIITNYSPISAKGGKRRFSRKFKKSGKRKRNNRRTRRRYH
jgi:hypothetical protein